MAKVAAARMDNIVRMKKKLNATAPNVTAPLGKIVLKLKKPPVHNHSATVLPGQIVPRLNWMPATANVPAKTRPTAPQRK